MLSELRMQLKTDADQFGYFQSSNMQGILMEVIDPQYAAYLHTLSYNPYSQAIVGRDEKAWCVRTTSQEAYERILLPLQGKSSFTVEKKEIHLEVTARTLTQESKQRLLDMFYEGEAQSVFSIEFETPTAFKSDGKYVIFPTPRLIFQSLMNKYSASFADMDMYDEDTLHQLETEAEIVEYRLRSCVFPIEGIKIPSFLGTIKIRLKGSNTMKKYAGMLLHFGEYSGVGIKTAMGMGAMKWIGRTTQ